MVVSTLKRDAAKIRDWHERSARRYQAKRRRTRDECVRWRQRVELQMITSGFRCEAEGMHAPGCNRHLPPHVGQGHHVHPKSWGGDDETSAVLWVHPDCHARIHSRPNDATALGYLTRVRE